MYWYNYLYADKKVHHISRLKYKIEKGMPHKGVYLIHLPECGSTLLEVIPSVLLRRVTILRSRCVLWESAAAGEPHWN